MKTKLLSLLLLLSITSNSQTVIKWVKTDKITARTDTVVFDSLAKFNKNIIIEDTVFIGNDTIYRIGISNDTLYFNNQTFTGGGSSTGFKWIVTGGGTDKIYTAVQAASAGDVVIVDAGVYTETNTISKDGVRLHGMNGAVVTKTTSGGLFNITGYTNDFIVTGDFTFNTTNQLLYVSSSTTNNPYLEYYKASNTAATLIEATALNGNITINGKYISQSSGGIVINTYGGTTYRANLLLLGGDYISTADVAVQFGAILSSGAGVNGTFKCRNIETTNASYYALQIFPDGASTTNPAKIQIDCDIKGTKALYFHRVSNANSNRAVIININGNINGNIVIGSANNIALTFNGNINNCTYTEGINTTYGVIFNGNISNSTFTFAYNNSTINGNIYQSIINVSAYKTQINGLYYYDAPENTTNTAHSTITGGSIELNGYAYLIITGSGNERRSSHFYINGGKLVVNGKIEALGLYDTDVTTMAIKLNSGILRLNGNGSIVAGNGSTGLYRCVEVSGNSTYIHNGGSMFSVDCINNAASVLTIKNYNNYFTNVARSGAGTYTETITGGGTEVVDTDVTE